MLLKPLHALFATAANKNVRPFYLFLLLLFVQQSALLAQVSPPPPPVNNNQPEYNYYRSDTAPRLVPLTVTPPPPAARKNASTAAAGDMAALRVASPIANSYEPDRSKIPGEIPLQSALSPTGAMTYSVPLQMVAGRNGVQPNLSLAYSSQSGNGVMGMGWNVSGLSAIRVTNFTIYYDGKTDAFKSDKNDPFTIDGVRLIKLSDNGSQVDYEAVQGNVRVSAYLSGNTIRYFKAFYPNGTTAIYGYEGNYSQQTSYPMTRYEDGYGNRIMYTYLFRNEHYYITKIEYGGTVSAAHFASLDFTYITRDDIATLYSSGKTITEDYLLDKIYCKSGSDPFRTYSFTYQQGYKVSLMKEINCSTSDGSVNPLRFFYGDDTYNDYVYLSRSNTQLYSWFSNTTVSNLKISSGKFDYGTNNDGMIVYPNLNPYLESFISGSLFSHSKKWYQNNFHPDQSLLVYQGLQDSWASPTVTVTAGTGFINLMAADIDGKPGEEVIKVNNYQSGSYDQVNFAIYKPNLYAGLGFSHNVTLNFSNILEWYDARSVHPKYFFPGDFNGDGKREMLVVSCNHPLGKAEIASSVYMVDLNTGAMMYQSYGLLNFNIDFANLSGQNDDKLVVMDYNGDGKDDIYLINDNGTDIYTFDPNGSSFTLRKVTTNTNLKKLTIKYNEWYIAELNGDGKPEIMVTPTSSSTYTWTSNMPVYAPRYCDNCFQEGTYLDDLYACSNCSNYMYPTTNCYECSSPLYDQYDWNTSTWRPTCYNHGTFVTVTHTTYYDNGNVWKAYFSKGDGSFDLKSLPIKNFDYGEKIVFQDMNKDGISDLVSNKEYSLNVYLGGYGTISGTPTCYDWAYPTSYLVPVSIAGYNYNSQLLNLQNGQVYKLSFPRNDGHQQLLTGAVNSQGVVSKAAYAYLNEDVYQYGYGNSVYTLGYGALFPYENYQGPFTVVTDAQTWLSNVKQSDQSYSYSNAILHRQGLGFLGFQSVQTYDEMKGLVNTRTSDPFNYGVVVSDVSTAAATNYTYNIVTEYNKLARVRLLQKTVNDQLKGTTVTTTYQNDAYGNPLTETVDYGGGLRTITSTSFINDVSATKNVVGVPASQTITQERNGSSSVSVNSFTYNTQYQPLTKTTSYNGNVIKQQTWAYDGYGNVTEEKAKDYSAAAWLINTYEYDGVGRFRTRATNPLLQSTTYITNANGTLYSQTDFKNNTSTYQYDSWQRITQSNNPDGTVKSTTYEWQPSGSTRLFAVKEEISGKPASKVHYDALNRKVRTTVTGFNGAEIHVDDTYDEYGRSQATSLPFTTTASGWTSKEYDYYDRPTQVTMPTGAIITYGYSGNNVTETKSGIGVTKTYNAKGDLVSVTNAAGTISYALRPDGQPASVTAAGGAVTSYAYDAYGRQSQLTDPSAGLVQYGYDAAGNLSNQTDANNKSIQTTFDNFKRILTKTTPEFSSSYAYNADGRIQTVSTSNGTSKAIWYDNLGRVTQTREEAGAEYLQVNFTYSTGRLLQVVYTAPGTNYTVNYQYNSYGYLYRLTDVNGTAIYTTNATNVFGQEEERLLGNGLLQSQLCDANGMLTGLKTWYGTNIVCQQELAFDNGRGNLSYRKDVNRNITENFVYDQVDRLTNYGISSNPMQVNYNNSTGNITAKTDAGSYNYNISGKPYAVSSVVSNGSPLPTAMETVSYASFARPTQIAEGLYMADFVYNDAYERTRMDMKSDGLVLYSRYYFGGGKYEKTVNANGSTYTLLYIDGSPYKASAVLENNNGSSRVLYISRDHLGSITHITDASGTLVAEYSYDAWGRQRNPASWASYALGAEPALMLHRGFTGHEYLPEFGLVNMNARLYDPLLGRMLSPDNMLMDETLSESFNRYAYGLNNPLKYKDPTGNFFIIDDFIIGFIKGAVLSIFGQHEGDHKTIFGDALASAWRHASVSAQVWGGLFISNSNKSFFGRVWEVVSRFTWQGPQTMFGFTGAHLMNMGGTVRDVDYFDGATVLQGANNGLFWGLGGEAMTLGSYILGNSSIDGVATNTLFAHEYGHYLQSQSVGLLYLPKYGIPSLFSRAATHNFHPVEQDANSRALSYFQENYGGIFNINNFIRANPILGYNAALPFNDAGNQAALNDAIIRTRWFDYPTLGTGFLPIYYSILFRSQQP